LLEFEASACNSSVDNAKNSSHAHFDLEFSHQYPILSSFSFVSSQKEAPSEGSRCYPGF
jgi:hypothetical protein